MADSEPLSAGDFPADPNAPTADSAPLPRWKKLLLIGAGVFVLLGVVLIPFEGSPESDLSTSSGQTAGQQGPGQEGAGQEGSGNLPPGIVTGFDAGNPQAGGGQPGDPQAQGAELDGQPDSQDLSPVFLKLGFSFFVGFAVGYAFRAFVKLALIFVGLQLLALFGLSYVEWVTVNWEVMGSAWDGFAERVASEVQTFKSFLTGSLPQASLGATGLYAGFRKS